MEATTRQGSARDPLVLSQTASPVKRHNGVAGENPALLPPTPYLDVLTIQSRRLLHQTREEISAKEREMREKNPLGLPVRHDYIHDGDGSRMEELLASVKLLLEPIQMPDLSHTGLIGAPDSTILQTTCSPLKGSSKSTTKNGDVKLFYPTGAKNANMREFVRETLESHLARSTLSSTNLIGDRGVGGSSLSASASTPVLGIAQASSPSSTKTKVSKKRASHHKTAGRVSPVKASLSPSALLNRELSRQAKDVIAAVRANSSKINELITK